ncbi:MAG: hypothetical protein ACRBBW_00840 [Cellvibrionaceae bacterium]
MNKNLLPDMTPIELQDRDGEPLLITLSFFHGPSGHTVFIGDGEGVHRSVIARNTAAILGQLVGFFDLDIANTTFVRHIVSPQGSAFGRFEVTWNVNEVASYTFKILHNLDEELAVRKVITNDDRVAVVEDGISLAC